MLLGKAWLSGITFSALCFRRKRAPWTVLCGMLVYVFCGCTFLCIYQSQFFMPMILFPLIILGLDRLMKDRKPGLYVISLAYSAFNSFYHTYMIAIFAVGYFLLSRLFIPEEERKAGGFGRAAVSFLGFSLLAAGIAAVSLLPMARLMMGMDRLSVDHAVPALYQQSYYQLLFRGFAGCDAWIGPDSRIGYSAAALIAVILLLITKGRKKQKTELLLLIAILCIPAAGYLMNGMGYVTNRWTWALSLLVAWLVTDMLPELYVISPKKRLVLTALLGLYIAISYLFMSAGSDRRMLLLYALALLICAAGFLFAALGKAHFRRFMIAATCVSVLVFSFLFYDQESKSGKYIPLGSAQNKAFQANGMPLLNLIDTTDGTRYSDIGLSHVRNAGWLHPSGAGGMSFYMSFYNSAVDQFHNSVALRTDPWAFGYDGLNSRSELYALLGVNHIFTKKQANLPVGFDVPEAKTGKISSWTPGIGKNTLFTLFDQSVSYEEYQTLSPYERQQILMKAIVLEDHPGDTAVGAYDIDKDEASSTVYTIKPNGDSLNVTDHGWQASKGGDGLLLSLDEPVSGEIYVYLDNISFENGRADECYITAEAYRDDEHTATSTIRLMNPYNHMYGGKHRWLLNLGNLEKVDSIIVKSDRSGIYRFDSIRIYPRDVEDIRRNLAGMEHITSGYAITKNRMDISVSNTEHQYLFAAVPYSEGWEAQDQGKPVRILKADVGFMGLELEPGEHEIVFIYHTPGFRTGLIISLFSLAAWLVLRLAGRKRKHE